MKVTIISNGQPTRMVITPENEIEKLQLQSLFKGEVEVRQMDKAQVIDVNLVDCVIIQPKTEQKQ